MRGVSYETQSDLPVTFAVNFRVRWKDLKLKTASLLAKGLDQLEAAKGKFRFEIIPVLSRFFSLAR